jgi:hypothetical protein
LRAGQNNPVLRLWEAHGSIGVPNRYVLNCGGGRGDGSSNLLTGGYDDLLQLWDTRSMKRWLSEVECGGDVWDIKEEDIRGLSCLPKSRAYLLGCMHRGFKMLSMGFDADFATVASYREHDSLACIASWL